MKPPFDMNRPPGLKPGGPESLLQRKDVPQQPVPWDDTVIMPLVKAYPPYVGRHRRKDETDVGED